MIRINKTHLSELVGGRHLSISIKSVLSGVTS